MHICDFTKDTKSWWNLVFTPTSQRPNSILGYREELKGSEYCSRGCGELRLCWWRRETWLIVISEGPFTVTPQLRSLTSDVLPQMPQKVTLVHGVNWFNLGRHSWCQTNVKEKTSACSWLPLIWHTYIWETAGSFPVKAVVWSVGRSCKHSSRYL